MVHGNISSENIQFKIKQIKNHSDIITDLRIVNYDFSYTYGLNTHTYFTLDKNFATKSMPPEMVHNSKLYYTNME